MNTVIKRFERSDYHCEPRFIYFTVGPFLSVIEDRNRLIVAIPE